jgi:hypothetical protein
MAMSGRLLVHEADPFIVQVDEVGQFQWPDGGFQGWEGSSQTILLAYRTRTMKGRNDTHAGPLLPEQRRGWSLMIFCVRTTRGLRRMERQRPGALLAHRAPTMKRWSLDVCSKIQPGSSHMEE